MPHEQVVVDVGRTQRVTQPVLEALTDGFGRRHGPVVRHPRSPMPNSVVSIDSYFSSDDTDDEDYRLAQQEWEESLEQLAQIASVVLLPFLGRWLGRRWSYWAYARYVRLGLGTSFFLGEGRAAS